jgi:hypothetical protein
MNTLSRRRFLTLTGAGIVAVAAGGIALAVRQFSESANTLTFQAVSGLPAKPLISYASYVLTGKIDTSNGTGTITKYVYAGPPESMTSISLYTRTVRVTKASQQGGVWHITGVVENQAQLQKGEDAVLQLQLDSVRGIAQASFFGSPIALRLQHFTAP